MIVLVSKILTPKGFKGITLFPFIFLADKKDKGNPILINHEKIHIRQQLELLIILFFLWYGLEFLFRLARYKNYSLAYRNISFEQEAYLNDKNLDYLKQRPFWRFLKYI